MKIFEIINPRLTKTTEPTSSYDDDSRKRIGSGAFNYAIDSGIGQINLKNADDPVLLNQLKRDSKFIWLMSTIKLAKSGNPYVPVVYDIKLHEIGGKYTPVYSIKKYYSIPFGGGSDKIDNTAILSMANDISESLYNDLLYEIKDYTDPYFAWEYMIKLIKRNIFLKKVYTDVNSQFMDVVNLVLRLKSKYDFGLDIKRDNFMIDPRVGGMKIIVTDPLVG